MLQRQVCLCCLLVFCKTVITTLVLFSQYEAKTRLESMSGSTSISSADLFGDGSENKGETWFYPNEAGCTQQYKRLILVLIFHF